MPKLSKLNQTLQAAYHLEVTAATILGHLVDYPGNESECVAAKKALTTLANEAGERADLLRTHFEKRVGQSPVAPLLPMPQPTVLGNLAWASGWATAASGLYDQALRVTKPSQAPELHEVFGRYQSIWDSLADTLRRDTRELVAESAPGSPCLFLEIGG